MITQANQATNEMFQMFQDTWNSDVISLIGSNYELRWQDIVYTDKIRSDIYTARIYKSNDLEGQVSLSQNVGSLGKKRFRVNGTLFIELYLPKSNDESAEKGEQIAFVVRDAFRGKHSPSRIWFINATIKRLPDDELFHRQNIIVTYQYDEIG